MSDSGPVVVVVVKTAYFYTSTKCYDYSIFFFLNLFFFLHISKKLKISIEIVTIVTFFKTIPWRNNVSYQDFRNINNKIYIVLLCKF